MLLRTSEKNRLKLSHTVILMGKLAYVRAQEVFKLSFVNVRI